MSQTFELRVPDIGDFKNVPVVELSVKVGDEVAADQTVAMIESDKATLDIPAPTAGRVTALKEAEGDRVCTGSVLMLLEAADAAAQKVAAPSPAAPRASAPAPAEVPAPAPVTAVSGVASTGLPPHASPAVRKFARELGVDPAAVTGTGPRGRITREDIQAFIKAARQAPAASGSSGVGLDLLPWPKVDYAKFGPVEREPLSRIKKISGPSLARNATIIPHVTNFEDADITDLEDFRKTVNAEIKDGAKLSVLPFVVKACVAALKAYPAFNSSLDGDALVLKKYYNIGVAAYPSVGGRLVRHRRPDQFRGRLIRH